MDDAAPPHPIADARRRARRAGPLVVGIVLVAAVSAACGSTPKSPGVASASAGKSATTTTIKPDAVAFSRCMREHGVKNFPDPDANGRITVKAQAGVGDDTMGPDSAVFKAAQEACKAYMPAPSAQDQQRDQAAMLKYAKCMRGHGIADFPDPQPGQPIALKGEGDLSPDSPAFQKAQEACKHLQPGGGGLDTQSNGAPPGS